LPKLTAEEIFTDPSHQFTKSGNKWRGSCPWHKSKSGSSFTVTVDSKQWWCQGCGFGGGPVQYRYRLAGGDGSPRGKEFVDTVRALAELAGVRFPERELTPEQQEAARRWETRRAILQSLMLLARQNLWSDAGQVARDYLCSPRRGITEDDLRALEFGLYLDVAQVEAWFRAKGFRRQDLKDAGVLNPKWAGYVCIPWSDEYGRPLTVYGRYQQHAPPDGLPKTLALPGENTKKSCLYYDRARQARHKHVVLVEGVLDAALAQVRGDSRVIACVAAQLSGEQAKTLARHRTEAVTVCLDPDQGGERGTESCLKSLESEGIAAYVAPALPENMDPDEYITVHGIDHWRAHVDRAAPAHIYRAERLLVGVSPGAEDNLRRATAARLTRYAAQIQNALHREDVLRLGCERTGYHFDTLRQQADSEPPTGGHESCASEPMTPGWEPPIPIGDDVPLPAFPTDGLPGWVADWVRAEAEATQTPVDLVAIMTLAVLGAGLAGRFRVQVRQGWQEPVNLFAVAVLPPGERKTAVVSHLLTPVQVYERELQQLAGPRIAELVSEHRMLEAKLKAAESRAAKVKDADEARQAKDDALALAKELDAHEVPDLPQLYCDDVTPEKLVNLLARQGGRILQASAEGTAFEIAKGRYSETANFDVYLKGHAGDPLRSDRISRDSDHTDQPALSVALAVQPDILRGLGGQPSMRGRGFLARFLYALPTSQVGKRKTRPAPVPPAVETRFHQNVRRVWDLLREPGTQERVLPLSPAADQAMCDFEQWLEPQLAEGEPLADLAGWANKLAGAAARIAGILHLAECVGHGGPLFEVVPEPVVSAAIRLGRDYFLPHALRAFGVMGADEQLEDARRVVRWLVDFCEPVNQLQAASPKAGDFCDSLNHLGHSHAAGDGGFCDSVNHLEPLQISQRDLHANVFGGRRKVEDVERVVELLVKLGYLRPVTSPEHTGRGRPKSPGFQVNPHLFSGRNPGNGSQNHKNGVAPS
jgi:DNA primase catalytic core